MINWRNPKEELPNDGDVVWVMVEPHKWRGSLKDSAKSIMIVCGEVCFSRTNNDCVVQDYDELGWGTQSWFLRASSYGHYRKEMAVAWLPFEEMPIPEWGF